MTSIEENKAQLYQGNAKRGKSGREILNRYRELVKERSTMHPDTVTVLSQSLDSNNDISHENKENQDPQVCSLEKLKKNPFQSVFDKSLNTGQEEELKNLNINSSINIINCSSDDLSSKGDGNVSKLNLSSTNDQPNQAGDQNNSNSKYSKNTNHTSDLEAPMSLTDVPDASLMLENDISNLSQILSSSNYGDDSNLLPHSPPFFHSQQELHLPAASPCYNEMALPKIDKNSEKLGMKLDLNIDDSRIYLMNESLISFPVSSQSDSNDMYALDKSKGRWFLTPSKCETSLVVSEDDENESQLESLNDDQASHFGNNYNITELSLDISSNSILTPQMSTKRVSSDSKQDEGDLQADRIKQLSSALKKSENDKKAIENRLIECEAIIKSISPLHPQTPQNITKQQNDVNSSAIISPVSKLLSLEDTPPGTNHHQLTTSSLMERNLTLVKEVRFADQTCVELSEKNLALEQASNSLKEEISKVKEEMDKLHNNVVEAEKFGAKMEACKDSAIAQLDEQKTRFDHEISNLQKNLEESKSQIEDWKNQAEIHHKEKLAFEQKLKLSNKKIDHLSSDLVKANETIACLTERISSYENVNESLAETNDGSLEELYHNMEMQMKEMQQLCHNRQQDFEEEQERNRVLSQERDFFEDQLNKISQNGIDNKSTTSENPCDISSHKEHNMELEKSLDLSQGQIKVLQDKLQKEEQNSKVLTDQLQHMTTQLDEYCKQKDECTTEMNSSRNVAESLRIELKDMVEECEQQKKISRAAIIYLDDAKEQMERILTFVSNERKDFEQLLSDNILSSTTLMDSHKKEFRQIIERKLLRFAERSQVFDQISFRLEQFLTSQEVISLSNQDLPNNELEFKSEQIKVDDSFDESLTFSPRQILSKSVTSEEYGNALDTFSCSNSLSPLDDSRLISILEEARSFECKNTTSADSSPHSNKLVYYTTEKLSRLREELKKSDMSRDDIEKDYESLLLMLDEAYLKMNHYKEFVLQLQESHYNEQRILMDELSAVKKNLECLENEKVELIRTAENKEKTLSNEKQHILAEVSSLKSKLQEEVVTQKSMQEKLDLARGNQNKLVEAEKKSRDFEEKNVLLQEKIAKLEANVNRLEESEMNLARLREDISILEKEKKYLDEQVGELIDYKRKCLVSESRCKEIEEIAIDLKDQNNDFEGKLSEIKRALEKTERERNDFQETNQSQKEKINELENSSFSANKQIHESKERVQRLQAELIEVKNQLNGMIEKHDVLLKIYEKLNSEHVESDEIWQQTLEEKDTLFCEFQELTNNEQQLLKQNYTDKTDALEKSLNEKVQSIALLESELEATKFEVDRESKKNSQVVKELRESIQELEDKLKEHEQEYAKLEAEYSKQQISTSESSNALQQEIDNLRTSLREVNSDRRNLKSNITALETRINEINNKMEILYKRLESSNSECSKLKNALQKSEHQKRMLENELASTLGDFDRLRDNNHKKVAKLSARLKQASEAKGLVTSKLDEKETCIDEFQMKLENALCELRSEQEKAANAEKKSTESYQMLNQAKLKNESLDRKCVRLREYIAKLTSKCEEWANSYRSLTKDLKKTKEDKSSLLLQIENLSSELKRIRKSCVVEEKAVKIEKSKRCSPNNGTESYLEQKYLKRITENQQQKGPNCEGKIFIENRLKERMKRFDETNHNSEKIGVNTKNLLQPKVLSYDDNTPTLVSELSYESKNTYGNDSNTKCARLNFPGEKHRQATV